MAVGHIPKKDKDGAAISSVKYAQDGRKYQSLHFEITIGQPGTLYCKDKDGNDITFLTSSFQDSDNQETENSEECVLTCVSLNPAFNFDIQGFCIYQKTQAATDIRVKSMGLPNIPTEYGGQHPFILNLNLKYAPYGTHFMDYVGDSATTLEYSGAGTTEMNLCFEHAVSTNHTVMCEVFWYI